MIDLNRLIKKNGSTWDRIRETFMPQIYYFSSVADFNKNAYSGTRCILKPTKKITCPIVSLAGGIVIVFPRLKFDEDRAHETSAKNRGLETFSDENDEFIGGINQKGIYVTSDGVEYTITRPESGERMYTPMLFSSRNECNEQGIFSLLKYRKQPANLFEATKKKPEFSLEDLSFA